MNKYVLTNYTVQCVDVMTGEKGCFIFDLGRYKDEGVFYAITPIYPDLDTLYRCTRPEDRKACYVEYRGA